MATGVEITGNTHYGGIPILLNKRIMTVLDEYVSYSNFTAENGEDFSVASASLSRGRGRCCRSARADH